MKQVQCDAGPTMKIGSGLAIQSTIEYSYFFKKKKKKKSIAEQIFLKNFVLQSIFRMEPSYFNKQISKFKTRKIQFQLIFN